MKSPKSQALTYLFKDKPIDANDEGIVLAGPINMIWTAWVTTGGSCPSYVVLCMRVPYDIGDRLETLNPKP